MFPGLKDGDSPLIHLPLTLAPASPDFYCCTSPLSQMMSLLTETLQCPTRQPSEESPNPYCSWKTFLQSDLSHSFPTWSHFLRLFSSLCCPSHTGLLALSASCQACSCLRALYWLFLVPELLFPKYTLAVFLTSFAQVELFLWSLPWLPYLKV